MRYTQTFRKGRGNQIGNRTKRNLPRRRTVYKRRHLEKTRQRRNKQDGSMFKQTLKSAKEIWKKVDDPLQQKKMFGGKFSDGIKGSLATLINNTELSDEFFNKLDKMDDFYQQLSKDGLTVTGDIEIEKDIIHSLLELKKMTNTNSENFKGYPEFFSAYLKELQERKQKIKEETGEKKNIEDIITKLGSIIQPLTTYIKQETIENIKVNNIEFIIKEIDSIAGLIVTEPGYNKKLTIITGKLTLPDQTVVGADSGMNDSKNKLDGDGKNLETIISSQVYSDLSSTEKTKYLQALQNIINLKKDNSVNFNDKTFEELRKILNPSGDTEIEPFVNAFVEDLKKSDTTDEKNLENLNNLVNKKFPDESS